MSPSVIDSLEGFYRLSVEDLAAKLRRDIGSLSRRQQEPAAVSRALHADEFLSVYLSEQSYQAPEPLREVPVDFLRASLVADANWYSFHREAGRF